MQFVIVFISYNIKDQITLRYKIIYTSPILLIIWLISCLAETNRTPFDFAEGESELVSGFNIEYGRLGFALIFIAEYASIFFLSLIFSFFFYLQLLFRANNIFFYCSIGESMDLSTVNISPVSLR